MAIKIGDLAEEIANDLTKYHEGVVDKINTRSKKVGKAAVKMLKSTSPKLTGDYAKSWRVKTEKSYNHPDTRTVYSQDPEYRKTHLLENGHATRDGGRTEAQPHLEPTEKMVIDNFTKEVEEALNE